MVDHITYTNCKNEEITFGENGIFITDSDLLDYVWGTETENNKIIGFNKSLKQRNMTICIKGTSFEDAAAKRNQIFEIFEKDVLLKKYGRLMIGDYYLRCYVIDSKKSNYIKNSKFIELKLKIIPEYPFWCHELEKTFLKGNRTGEEESDGNLSYPYSYPYRYSTPSSAGSIVNDHYAACDFKMIIYGPCTDPAIRINGHLYEVKTTLYTGDYIVIDSRDNTVFRYLNDGRTENLFNWRYKDSSLFEKIPAGQSSVVWNVESFGFDVILFQERSEPKWIL